MTDYKKKYLKYKLKYLLLKQKNLQFKQKAGSLPTSHSIENFISQTIDYIKNLLFPEENNLGLNDILNESDIEYEDSDQDDYEDTDEDSDEDDYEDETHTPPNTPILIGTRTPPKNTDNGPVGAGSLNFLSTYIPSTGQIHTLNE